MDPDRLLTPAEASTYLDRSVSGVYRLTNNGTLKTVTVERGSRSARMIPLSELERFQRQNQDAAVVARSMLDRAIAEGLMPAEPPSWLLAKVARYLKHGKAA